MSDANETTGEDSDGDQPERPAVQHQMSFSGDGTLEAGEPAETSLGDWGAGGDGREKETRIDRPAATSFGVDDRAEVRRSDSDSGEQERLFRAADESQRTLSGEQAAAQPRFEGSSQTADSEGNDGDD